MEGGKVPAMYWSDDWKEAEWNASNEKFKPKELPMFDWSGNRPQPEAVIFERQYHPTEPVYGRLFWLGCKRAAEVKTVVVVMVAAAKSDWDMAKVYGTDSQSIQDTPRWART